MLREQMGVMPAPDGTTNPGQPHGSPRCGGGGEKKAGVAQGLSG
jgi:hypothetical protein